MNDSFDPQPVLESERVIVRPLVAADWDGLFAAAADPEIWAQHPATDRYVESVFREFFDTALNTGSAFSIVDRNSGRIVGSSRYHGADFAASEIEIGWTFLARAFWGGAVNREVKQLMLDHAFRWFETVLFWIGEENQRSRRAIEKIGGRRRDGVVNRAAGPHVVYEIQKVNWVPAS